MCIQPLLLVLATSVVAGATSPGQLSRLVEEGLRHNPEVLAAQKRLEAARAEPAQPHAPPAEANADAARLRAAQSKAVSRVKQAYYRLHQAYVNEEVLEGDRELLRNLLSVTQENYSVGKALQQDIFKAQVQVSLMNLRLIEAERDLRTCETEINALVGRPADSPAERPPDTKPAPIGISLEELEAKATQAAHVEDGRATPYRIRDDYLIAESASKLMEIYSTTILPQSRVAAHSALVSYENGGADFLSVLTNYVTFFTAESSYHEQVEQLFLALARLEELTGVELIH